MERFEYEISTHTAERFNAVVYFCGESGDCHVEDVNREQTDILMDILNDRGDQGWELVQISFGKESIMAFWKRRIGG